MRKSKKAENQQLKEEVSTDLAKSLSDIDEQPKKDKKRMSKIKLLSVLWTAFMLCVYVVLDAIKIVKNGWTTVNIIITTFLGVQIILFIVFTAISTRDKKTGKHQKTAFKWVKKAKKLTLKLTTVVTSILMLVNVETISFGDVFAAIVAIISLLFFVISLIFAIKKQIKKAKKEKLKQNKKNKKLNNPSND